jgi:hypothetical protein
MSQPHRRSSRFVVAGMLLAALGAALLPATPVAAAPQDFTVVNALPLATDAGSLAWAITQANANPGSRILFDAGLRPSLVITADPPAIEQDVTVLGPGSGLQSIETPDTVFTITGTAPGSIAVAITGLTLQSTTAGTAGVTATNADVTLTDLVATGFGLGVSVVNGSLDATAVDASGNGTGLYFDGNAAGQNLTLEDVTANGGLAATFGVYASTQGSSVTIDGLTTDENITYGLLLSCDGGSISITDAHADGNGVVGIGLGIASGAIATITDSSATGGATAGFDLGVVDAGSRLSGSDLLAEGNESYGIFVDGASGGGILTLTGVTARANDGNGIDLAATSGGSITITNSLFELNGPDPCGCGGSGIVIEADDAEVTISNTDVLDNRSDNGAGIDVPAFTGDALLTIEDSTIARNTAQFDGGGIGLYDLGVGNATGGVTILRTTIDGNTATTGDGAGIAIDNLAHRTSGEPIVLVSQSTISGNAAPAGVGGGIWLRKDGVDADPAILDLLDSTISGNTATDGAGLFLESDGAVPGALATRVRHTTVAANAASAGTGGVLAYGGEQSLALDHALLGDNGTDLDSTGPVAAFAARFSLVELSTLTLPAGQGNIEGVDPRLSPLADNGGPTRTHMLLDGSPAFNTGDPNFVPPPTSDQRGEPRVFQIIDIGALERRFALPPTGRPTPTPAILLTALGALLTGFALTTRLRGRTRRAH